MGIEDVFIEAALEPNKTEHKFLNVPKYVKITGGGIYWAICYWILYSAFAQEIIRRQDKLDYIIVGLFVGFAIGLFLSIGVYLHIQFFKRYRNNIVIWTQDKELQLEEERKAIERNCNERLNKMAGKLNAAQATAITLYNWHQSGKPWPTDLDEVWNKLYDFIRS